MATERVPRRPHDGRQAGSSSGRASGPSLPALLHVRIPMSARTYYFGGIALFLFGVQVVTGTLLALYYSPTPEAAYKSVQSITSDVSFGWLIRSIHHWAANLMILFVALHLGRVFFQAAYKYPRELTWVIGIGLLLVTLGFGFTGYLLPWDQRAYWATVVGTEIAGGVPLVGDQLLLLLRGGPDVTGATMSRFFGIHVLVLPHRARRAARLPPPPRPPARAREPEAPGATRPPAAPGRRAAAAVLPPLPRGRAHRVVRPARGAGRARVDLPGGPRGAGQPDRDSRRTSKPEWYYLAVYELLKFVPTCRRHPCPDRGRRRPAGVAVPRPEPGGARAAPEGRRRDATARPRWPWSRLTVYGYVS